VETDLGQKPVQTHVVHLTLTKDSPPALPHAKRNAVRGN
jgi:hypothetical protein